MRPSLPRCCVLPAICPPPIVPGQRLWTQCGRMRHQHKSGGLGGLRHDLQALAPSRIEDTCLLQAEESSSDTKHISHQGCGTTGQRTSPVAGGGLRRALRRQKRAFSPGITSKLHSHLLARVQRVGLPPLHARSTGPCHALSHRQCARVGWDHSAKSCVQQQYKHCVALLRFRISAGPASGCLLASCWRLWRRAARQGDGMCVGKWPAAMKAASGSRRTARGSPPLLQSSAPSCSS